MKELLLVAGLGSGTKRETLSLDLHCHTDNMN